MHYSAEQTADVGDVGYIDMVFVDPKFGRRGVAGALLAPFHNITVEEGALKLPTNTGCDDDPLSSGRLKGLIQRLLV